ncbi:MAG: dipeptidase [Rhizobiales bacterium]|nr:dipeptidase [Hyphomicrobiales bacterium]
MAIPAEEKARKLLARTRLIDGHNDLPYVIWRNKDAGGNARLWDVTKEHPEHDTDLPKLRAGQVATQVFTAFIPTFENDPLRARLEVIDVMLQMEQAWPDVFLPVLEPRDILRARKSGQIGMMKAVEGLVGIDHVGHLRLFHAMGVRLVTLCHNETLPFVDSATDTPGKQPLSSFGVEVIAEMERLGLIIDLAHVSVAAQHAVMDVAKGPVLISHANARALCPHLRNAPDDILRRLADKGGVCMATFVPVFLAPRVFTAMTPAMDSFGKALPDMDRTAYRTAKRKAFSQFAERDGVQWLCDHLDHMKNVMGEDGVGIGSDFYGGPNPPGLEDASTFPKIFAELIRRRWKTRQLEKLACGNFERLWRDVYRAQPKLPG